MSSREVRCLFLSRSSEAAVWEHCVTARARASESAWCPSSCAEIRERRKRSVEGEEVRRGKGSEKRTCS